MIYLIASLIAGSVTLAVIGIGEMRASQARTVAKHLNALSQGRSGFGAKTRTSSPISVQLSIRPLIQRLGGSRRERAEAATDMDRQLLISAGIRTPDAATLFRGAKLFSVLVGVGLGSLIGGIAGASAGVLLFNTVSWGMIGFIAPRAYLRIRGRARQKQIQQHLPDAVDLLVVSIEAGLGLNQALVRVATEITHFSPAIADELMEMNMSIRAGVEREQALRDLAERVPTTDMRSLTGMLIQAERFGSSITQGLRVYSDTSRTKRRQKAEELAAKATVKLIFPLVFCMFPTLFVVILGPLLITVVRSLASGF
jgi:tight adherence protein C